MGTNLRLPRKGLFLTAMFRTRAYFLLVPVVVSVVVWFSFQNSLDNAFVFDDHLAITNNNDVKDPATHRIWTNDIWGKELSAHDSHKSFRPLLMMLFRKLWSISSEARWFREVSVGAHVVASILLFYLTSRIWNSKHIGFATALIFAAHPIHVESVSAVVNMAEAFSGILIMASYIIFLRQTAAPTEAKPRRGLARAMGVCFSASIWIVLVIVAALFKETGITACLLVIAKTIMDAVLGGIAAVKAGKTGKERSQRPLTAVGAYVVYFFTAVLVLYVYMAGRTLMTSPHRAGILSEPRAILYNLLLKPVLEWQRESYLDTSQLLRRAENPFAQLQGLEKRLSTMYLHCLYLIKLVYPAEQSPEYAFNCIPKVASLQDPRVWHIAAAYGSVLLAGLLGFYQALRPGSALWSSSRTESSALKEDTVTLVKNKEPAPSSAGTRDDEGSNVDDISLGEVPSSSQITVTNLDSDTAAGATQVTKLTAEPSTAVQVTLPAPSTDTPHDAILHTLMLFVVFFLPASGLVFKLGTLLAERLMYTPSMPVCMFLASAAYFACCTAARVLTLDFASAPAAVDTKIKSGFTVRFVVTQLLFWIVIVAATYAYSQRTIEYNKVWKDDNTLFVESLKVCPNSAKMNLQVSKVWSQKGDFKKARKHLERAQAIDPDFCDSGYQDAVLTAAGEGKGATLDLAAEKAVKNLHCIYTNTATLTLLNQIWSAQLQSVTATGDKKRLYREFEKQGKIASKGEVKFLAAQKFIEASSIAFDAQEPEDAISLATQAEKIVTAFEKKSANSSAEEDASANEETEVTADLRCRIFTLSGLFRASQLAQASAKAGKKGKNAKKGKKAPTPQQAETRVLQLLHRAVFRDCREATMLLPYPATGPVTGRGAVAVEHLPIAVNHLVSLWTAQMSAAGSPTLDSNSRPVALEAYAGNLTAVLYVTELLRSRTSYPIGDEESKKNDNSSHTASATSTAPAKITVMENAKVKELSETVAKLASNAYYMAGTHYLQAGQQSSAVDSFRQSLFVFIPSNLAAAVAERAVAGVFDGPLPSVLLEELPGVVINKESCMSMHWLSETLASLQGFRSNPHLIAELTTYLKLLVKCLKTKAYSSPKLSVANLKALVRTLTPKPAVTPATSAAPAAVAEVEVAA